MPSPPAQNPLAQDPLAQAALDRAPTTGDSTIDDSAATSLANGPPQLNLSCPVCDAANVQKVSAIYDSGTQNSTSHGTTKGGAVGLGYVPGAGAVPLLGFNSSQTTTRHFSQTRLAAMLEPPSPPSLPQEPPRPYPPTRYQPASPSAAQSPGVPIIAGLLGVAWALPGALFYSLGYRPTWNVWGFLFGCSVGPLLAGLGFGLYWIGRELLEPVMAARRFRAELSKWDRDSPHLLARWQEREAAWRQKCAAIERRGQEKKANWNRLFYCHRCDLVFHIERGTAAPPAEMNSLL